MKIPEVSFGIAPDEDNELVLTYVLDLDKEEVSNFDVISFMALVISAHLRHSTPNLEHFKHAVEVFKEELDEYVTLAEQHEEEK